MPYVVAVSFVFFRSRRVYDAAVCTDESPHLIKIIIYFEGVYTRLAYGMAEVVVVCETANG